MTKKEKKKATEEQEVLNNEQTETTENVEQTEETTSEKEQEETSVGEEEKELSEVEQLQNKVNELNDKYMRLSAEYDNYRKRTLKEKMELTKHAGEKLLLAVLPITDDFDRALSHLNEASDLEAVKQGIELISNKFSDFLGQNGIKEIEAKDKDFDTDLHEAITKIPAPSEDMKGKVIDCIEKGYLLNEKVIRFAKVVVGE